MDFIGNLLNQMSSAFNQETAIPKKEEISMDETLKWRALKNNQFASRTRGGVASTAPQPGAVLTATGATGAAAPTRGSGSSIGRRSAGGGRRGGTSNGQRKHRQQRTSSSENSNDSTRGGADGLLSGLEEEDEREEEEEEEEEEDLLTPNGVADDAEEDIEIEIAKDISGEELQEALGLSQLVEVEPMEVGSTMGEGQEQEQHQPQPVAPPTQCEQEQRSATLTVEKKEPKESETTTTTTTPDENGTLLLRDDRKQEAADGIGALEARRQGSLEQNSTSTNDPTTTERHKVEIGEQERDEETQRRARSGDRGEARDDRAKKELPSNGPPEEEGTVTSASGLALSAIGEGKNAVLKGENNEGTGTDTTAQGLAENDEDDDVLIITTDEMTDVVELAETSKEEEDDDDDDEEEEEDKEEKHEQAGTARQKSGDRTRSRSALPVNSVTDPKVMTQTTTTATATATTPNDEAEEKYDPTQPRDVGMENVDDSGTMVEAKYSPTLDAARTEGRKQETDVDSPSEPKPPPPPGEVEEKKPAAPRAEPVKEREEASTGGDTQTVGRTTRSKKAASSVVAPAAAAAAAAVVVPVESSNIASSTPSQRRSQRFQAKESVTVASGGGGCGSGSGRKSTDVKLNGSEPPQPEAVVVVVVKEEDTDEGTMKRKATASGGAGVTTTGKAPSAKTGPATAGASGSTERSASVVSKSDRSLRSRQQSTSSVGAVVVTRRSSETVKSVGLDMDSTNESTAVDTTGSLNRRGRKRLSQEPAAPTAEGAAMLPSREKAARGTTATPTKEEPVTISGESGFPLDPGENDSGGKAPQEPEVQEQEQGEQKAPQPPEAPADPVVSAPVESAVASAPVVVQRRGRKRKTQNPPETGGAASAASAASGATPSASSDKPPPYKRAARVSRDGSDGILASALARRDKVDPQGRLSRPIKLSAKMLANEELRHGFEQHNNSRIIIGSDSSTVAGQALHDEAVEREKERDRTEAGGSEKPRRQQQHQQQQQQQQQQEVQTYKEVNLPPSNSAISSSSEDVVVVSVTYPTGKGPAKGSQFPVGKDTPPASSAGRKQSDASTSDPQRSTAPASGKPHNAPPTNGPDEQTFLQEVRALRIGTSRSPEENRKLNRRQTKRLAKLKEKLLLAVGLQRKGAHTAQQQHPMRNGAPATGGAARKSSAEVDDELLLSEPEPESESSGSEADFVPRQKIGTVGKPSVTLRLRKPETLLERSPVSHGPAASSSRQQQQQQQRQQPHPPLVTVPSAMVNRGSGVGRQPSSVRQGAASKQSQSQQPTNSGRMGANARRSSAAVVLPAAITTERTASPSASVERKDSETEKLQRSLERLGCELTVIPTPSVNSSGHAPSGDGRSSSSSSSTHNATQRKRTKEPQQQQRQQRQHRSLVRPNHHHQYRSQGAASPSTASALAATSPSLQIVLEKSPPSAGGKTNNSTSTPGGPLESPPASAGGRPLLCLCRQTSDMYVASSVGTGYCTAVDDIDGQRIGCCNELVEEFVHMLRPSPAVSFQLLCNLHRKRLEDHNCCAICGVYCTQGNFAMCNNAHIFHPDCAVKYILNAPYDPARPGDHTAPTLVLQCPHCAQERPNGEIQVTIHLTTPPVLLPSRKNIVKPAKMAIAKSKGSTNGGDGPSAKEAFRANVEAFVPSSVRSVLAAGGPTNGHDSRRSSPMVAGGSGTGARNHFTTKQIFEAIHKDNVDRITEIIFSGFDIETRFRDFHDGTCLHLVSNFGSIGMAYLIISRAQSVDFLDILDRELRTALMCAVLGAKIDIVKLLLDCGADVTVKGPDGLTVLHLAAKLGQHEAVRMILDTARKRLTARDLLAFVNRVDNGSYTALVWAAENRHKETIQLLLEVGADVNICDKENNTSLHWAAMAGCSDTMHLLVKKGCDPNVQNINGDTPLHLACRHGNGTICVQLLTMGASLNVRNTSNELPQDMIQNPNSECASIIAANVKMSGLGRNTKETRILCSDISNGREHYPVQVVHVAGRNDRHQAVPKFKYIKKSVQIENPIDINLCDMIVCSCEDSCTTAESSCLCSERTWYTEDGRLVSEFDFLEPPMIVECGDLCDCNELLCRNRVVQKGLRVPLQMFYSPGKAWGVRTLVPIPKGTFLVEYVGELLTDEMANQRPDDTYFFDLNSGFCIDANAYGNVSRFFNHSCDPNVSPVSVYYEHQDKRFPKVAMFACRDIKAQEEICFNYGEKFWMVKNRTMSCLCNASECRYRTVQQGGGVLV